MHHPDLSDPKDSKPLVNHHQQELLEVSNPCLDLLFPWDNANNNQDNRYAL
jgi:hypothetical protein